MFTKENGKFKYRIALPNNDAIVKFVSIAKGLQGEVTLTGSDNGIMCSVNGKSLLGSMYASVLDDLHCTTDTNVLGAIAQFIIEDD